MVIRLTPTQVPQHWDVIKYAAVHAERIREKDRPMYLTRLLHALLSGTAQCFFRINEDRELLAVEITRIMVDEITGEKSLFLNCLFSFKAVSEEQWKSDMEVIKDFAKVEDCKKITTYSTHPRVFEIVDSLGFEERYRCFVMEV